MYKMIIGVSALLGLIAAPAQAADLPVKAPPPPPVPTCIWCGFYVGGSAGYGWAPTFVSPFATGTQSGVFFDGPAQLAARLAGINTPVHITPRGGLAGLQFGYNWEIAQSFIVSFEADYSWANVNGSTVQSNAVPVLPGILTTTNLAVNDSLSSFGTFRGRLGGTPIPTILVYGTGGFAFGRASSSSSVSAVQTLTFAAVPDAFTPIAASASKTLTGISAGFGAEWAFAPHWSLKGEFLYYDLGRLDYLVGTSTGSSVALGGLPFLSTTVNASTHFFGDVVRVGVNYEFGWGGPVAAKY
jgi:outer membrane immunogenic protein